MESRYLWVRKWLYIPEHTNSLQVPTLWGFQLVYLYRMSGTLSLLSQYNNPKQLGFKSLNFILHRCLIREKIIPLYLKPNNVLIGTKTQISLINCEKDNLIVRYLFKQMFFSSLFFFVKIVGPTSPLPLRLYCRHRRGPGPAVNRSCTWLLLSLAVTALT